MGAPFCNFHKADKKAIERLDAITNQFYCFSSLFTNLLSKCIAFLPLDENLVGPIDILIDHTRGGRESSWDGAQVWVSIPVGDVNVTPERTRVKQVWMGG